MRRRWLASFVVLALALAATKAESQAPPLTSTLRTAARLVQINVVVRNKNGPVDDLAKNDFVLFDQGRRQTIRVFSVVSGSNTPPAIPPPPLDTFSNVAQSESPNSVTIVLLDNLNTLYGSAPGPYEDRPYWTEDLALINAKGRLLEVIKQLSPQERVALYGLTHSLHVLCDFTSDRALLVSVLSHYDTSSRTSRESVEPGAVHTPGPGAEFDSRLDLQAREAAALSNECRAAETMAALQAIAAHVAAIPGRKNLIWLTANIPFSAAVMARILLPAQIAVYPIDGRGLLSHQPVETLEGVEDEDAEAQGHFMPAQAPQPPGIANLQKVAAATGGRAFLNTNDLAGAIRKAVGDSAVTYTLGFYISSQELDGKFHKVKVQIKRPGVTARYPGGYFADPDTSASQKQTRNQLSAAIRNPIEASAIPLQVHVQRIRGQNSFSLNG